MLYYSDYFFVFYFLSGIVFLMSGLLSEKNTALRLVDATVLQMKLDSPHSLQTLCFPTQKKKKQQKEEVEKNKKKKRTIMTNLLIVSSIIMKNGL